MVRKHNCFLRIVLLPALHETAGRLGLSAVDLMCTRSYGDLCKKEFQKHSKCLFQAR